MSNFAVRAAPSLAGRGAWRPFWRHVHASATVLYVCVPTHNEAVTVGVLLWRLRTVLREQAGGRDYELVVYDDASTDATSEVLAPYAQVLPLTLLAGATRVGQTGALDALMRHVLIRSRTPESDAAVIIQADYTDSPDLLPSLLERFDAGADLVLTRRPLAADQPLGERRLRRATSLLVPPLARSAVRDPVARDPATLLSVMRLVRVSVLRDAVRAWGDAPLVAAPGWAGTAEWVVRTAPFARRTDVVDAPARYDVRTRPSRVEWMRELRAITASLWQHRGASSSHASAVHLLGKPSIEPGQPRRATAPTHASLDADVASVQTVPVHPAISGGATSSTAAQTPRDVALDVVGGAPVALAPVPTTPADASGAPKSRRRRRGRGRAGGPSTLPDPQGATSLESPADAPGTPTAPAPTLILLTPTPRDDAAARGPAAPDAADRDADARDQIPGASPKRRRRRGGARRRASGAADDSGVRDGDADAATGQGASSDQTPS